MEIFTQAFIEISQNQQLFDFFGDNIYRAFIPENILQNVNDSLPIACLYDISNQDKGYASNRSRFSEGILQFSCWATDFEQLDEVCSILVEIMPTMGYERIFFHTQFDGEVNIPQLIIRYKYQK